MNNDGLLGAMVRPIDTIRWIRCWADGGVIDANPSPRGVYWSLRVEAQGMKPVVRRCSSPDYSTNNEAEWLALREALMHLLTAHPGMPAVVHSDSKLIVNQFNGIYAVRDPRMIALWTECRELAVPLREKLFVRHVPRTEIVVKLGH